MERDVGQLARHVATRTVGLAALSGLAALGLNSLATGTAAAAAAATSTPKSTVRTPTVTTSVTFALNLHISLPKNNAITVRGTGQADFAHQSVTMAMDVATTGLHLSTTRKGAPKGGESLQIQGEWVGGTAYIKVPASLSSLDGGAQELSYAAPAAVARQLDTALSQSAVALTYAHILAGTLAAQETQHHMGTRTMSGVSATGTKIDLTLAQLLKVIPGLAPAMTNDAQKMADTEIPVTVWVDKEGRLVEATMAAPATSGFGSIIGTVRFSDYNAPVTITAPAAGTVKAVSKSELSLLESEIPFGTKG
jgi:hypothetical protein